MAALFRELLVNVAAAAILGGISLQAVKDGPLHEVVRVAAGLMMTLALLVPLSRTPAVKMVFSNALGEVQSAAAFAALENQRITASSVGNAIAVYIQDRSKEMGVNCTASVHMEGDEKGMLVTRGVTLYIEGASEDERAAVCEMVAQECGIPIYLLEVKGR